MNTPDKPTAWVMVGLPGSGKTSWARAHPGQPPVVSIDTFIEDYAATHGLTYDAAFMEASLMAKKWMRGRLAELIEARRDFIWDHLNLTRTKRLNIYRKLHPTHRVVFVCMCVPVEVCIARVETRERRGTLVVNRENILRWAAEATFPMPGDPFDEVIPVLHPAVKTQMIEKTASERV